jgi:Reverse transcriptase (RNA-dependent DNA polymerase)/Group II intron, maturase-specific domain
MLLNQILSRENMLQALKRVEQNKGSHGVDMMPVQNLRQHIVENWLSIKEAILKGTYEPMPVRRVEIPKPDGGVRLLGIPTVTDRLIQQAIAQVLSKVYDPTFSENSYGFRPNRSAHDAVRKAKEYIRDGHRWVVDMDLEKFFDKVNHDRLMGTLAKRIQAKPLLKLIRKYLMGWCGYFALADTKSIFLGLDKWIRRRLRMCLWKNWKKPKTKIRNLIQLGVPQGQAYEWGNTRKSYWRISNSPILHRTLGNSYWRNQGLKSLEARYENLRQ